MHVSSTLSFNDIASTQMKPLQQQFNVFSTQYQISINRKASFLTEFKRLFNGCFNDHLPITIEQRALTERQLILSIRRQLKQDQLVLRRTANQRNLFCLCNVHQFTTQSQNYVDHTPSYEHLAIIIDSNSMQAKLNEICKSIDTILIQLRRQSRIQEHHLSTMSIKRANVAFPYLYFLPESGQHDLLKLSPFISSCRNAPIKQLASYLDGLLRPLYESSAQSTIVLNGMDFIGKLAHFDQYALLPHTIFATFKVIDIYMKVSYESIEQALGRFLTNVLPGNRHQNLTIETIQQLTKLVLCNNYFIYDNHLYRYVKGSPLSLPLTRTLVNIYLHDWQATLVNHLNSQDEFYVRYHDTAFLSWQRSFERLQILLEELNEKHSEIRIEYTIGSNVHFLGVTVENQSGQLHTQVYHDPNMPRFTLPYVIGHPRLLYRQWYQWILARAVRYCTSIEDFNQERIQVEMTLLSYGFPLEFVELGMKNFLKKYFVIDFQNGLDTRSYISLREHLFSLIQLEKQHRQKQEEWKLNKQIVHMQYLYDWGLRSQFNQQFRVLWLTHIINDPIVKNRDIKLKLGSIHCYPLNVLLAQVKN